MGTGTPIRAGDLLFAANEVKYCKRHLAGLNKHFQLRVWAAAMEIATCNCGGELNNLHARGCALRVAAEELEQKLLGE